MQPLGIPTPESLPPQFGPLAIIYCWQSFALSLGVWVMAKITNSALLIWAGEDKKKLLVFKKVLMPLVPLVWGMILVFLAPLLPDELVKYATTVAHGKPVREWLYYLAYGACVGQFSSYLHDRVTGLLQLKSPAPIKSEEPKP